MIADDEADLRFAVVIPAFNRERFIGAAIESALAQTLPASEIIVVDDGSTDRTAEIVATFPPPVRLIRIENNGAGPSRPRNVGIAAAKSEYITLLDSDDRLAPTVLENHRNIFVSFPNVALVCSNYCIETHINGSLTDLARNDATMLHAMAKREVFPATYLIQSSEAYRAYCSGNFILTPGTTFPKCAWSEAGGFDETLPTSEDYAFFLRVLRRHDIAYIDEALKTICHHDANIYSLAETHFVPERYLNHLRVLETEFHSTTSSCCKAVLRSSILECLRGLAYAYRESGRWRASLAAYFNYLAWGGNPWIALKSIGKVPLCCVRDIVRGESESGANE
ncbi:MAG: glycosyltransferase family 2 protein [Pirellulales bacterium]